MPAALSIRGKGWKNPPKRAAFLSAFLLAACASSGPSVYDGLRLRTDRAPADAVFTNADLLRNFRDIALKSEFADGAPGADGHAAPIAKWTGPVRYALKGGDGDDRLILADLAARIRQITGLDFASAEAEANPPFTVRIVSPLRRMIAATDVPGAEPGGSIQALARRWAETDEFPCVAFLSWRDPKGPIARAEILIKSEAPERVRRACIVEEVTQSLGLLNDSRRARPSIFNDDQEFGDLTEHDEYLLRVLYDPRIRPGMRAVEAMPIAERIIAELRPEFGAGS